MHILSPFSKPDHRADAPVPTTHRPFEADGEMPLSLASMKRIAEVARNHFTLRSLPMNVGIAGTWWFFRELVKRAQQADDRLYPEWRETNVERPVFIFASARSGTTMLHRLMSLDEERWATIRLYQTIFPTVTAERVFERVQRIARGPLGRAVSAVPEFIDARFFGGWKGVHPMSLDAPEEDECLFVFSAVSPTITLLLPFADELASCAELDRLPPADREAFLDFYEGSLRRFLHANGRGRRLLNKNVFTGPRLASLAGRFPDARFVFLVRHPYDSLGSYLSMWHRAWQVHRPEIAKDSEEARAYARMALSNYREALAKRALLGNGRLIVVHYDDLLRDPEATVGKLYEELGETVSPAFRRQLAAAAEQQKSFRSEHQYSLEEFGITREWLYQQLPDVYAEFGFEP